MKLIILSYLLITPFLLFSQSYIQTGDTCFVHGDYNCAISNYDTAFNNTTGKNKQIAEIKLTRATWCVEHIKMANQAFSKRNYQAAKDEYQKVLDSNPKDTYAQSQIIKCEDALTPPKLRIATTTDLTDIWNNKYGVNPQRRQNLINAGIDPDDAQRRINAGEGKPQEKEKEKESISLTISKSNLYFKSGGGTSEQIIVYSEAGTYSIPLGFLPSWCTVNTYSGYFTVTANANPDYRSRKDWFKVTAGGKEVRINVEQAAGGNITPAPVSRPVQSTLESNANKCFNCPYTQDSWGLSLGYTQQTLNDTSMDVVFLGLKFEPLFKFGFGLNTGVNFLGYSEGLFESHLFKNDFNSYAVNIPLHLEYRLNFSKWINIFFFGGAGFNILTDRYFDDYTLPVTFEYGGGLRINRVQLNVGRSLFLGDLRNTQNFGKKTKTYQNLILSVSFMF